MNKQVSLVIPVFNESETILSLIQSIREQSLQPDEVIFVDGGSTDQTVLLIRSETKNDSRFKLIEAGRAMPGKGRNIGTAAAGHDWIAYTDAGITLDPHWMMQLVKTREETGADIIYGNFSPQVYSLFEKAAAIAYVPALQPGQIRTKSIASCLLRKSIWEKAGGFPDWRATEDLVFIERADKASAKITTAVAAMVSWKLRPGLVSTFKKFTLYSAYNVWAGRQAFWHYGIARQYLFLIPFILLGIFHSWLWLLAIPAWLGARTAKRAWMHRYEYGTRALSSPVLLFLVALITLTIDLATYTGWVKALLNKQGYRSFSSH
jgi:glycosyltransferase involved in cell wall biosynthesis